MVTTVSQEQLRKQIDALELSPRLQRLRTRYFDEAPQVCAQRLKYAMEGWKEGEGQPVEIRSAMKLKSILEGMPIVIHDGEITSGNQSRFFRGCAPFSDWDSEYFQRFIKKGEVFRIISFGIYWVVDGKFKQIKAARYKLVNEWQMEE